MMDLQIARKDLAWQEEKKRQLNEGIILFDVRDEMKIDKDNSTSNPREYILDWQGRECNDELRRQEDKTAAAAGEAASASNRSGKKGQKAAAAGKEVGRRAKGSGDFDLLSSMSQDMMMRQDAMQTDTSQNGMIWIHDRDAEFEEEAGS